MPSVRMDKAWKPILADHRKHPYRVGREIFKVDTTRREHVEWPDETAKREVWTDQGAFIRWQREGSKITDRGAGEESSERFLGGEGKDEWENDCEKERLSVIESLVCKQEGKQSPASR